MAHHALPQGNGAAVSEKPLLKPMGEGSGDALATRRRGGQTLALETNERKAGRNEWSVPGGWINTHAANGTRSTSSP